MNVTTHLLSAVGLLSEDPILTEIRDTTGGQLRIYTCTEGRIVNETYPGGELWYAVRRGRRSPAYGGMEAAMKWLGGMA